jgi:membrane AbrB-like protein
MQTVPILKTFMLAGAGGFLFFSLHIPLAWMLGPLTTVVLWTQVGKKSVCWPINLRNAALIFLGYVIGSAFTAAAAQQIIAQLPVMLAVTFSILLVSLGCGYITHRQAGISLASGLMGSVPGGFSQMVLLSEEIDDADMSVVSFMHTVRLLSVVFIVPYLATQAATTVSAVAMTRAATSPIFTFLTPDTLPLLAVAIVSAFIAKKICCPTPFLLGPILGTALISMNGIHCPALPAWLTILAQIAVGTYMGSGIHLASLTRWRILLASTMMGVAVVLAMSLAVGYLMSSYYGYSNVTSFLSMAPGGVAEMSVTGIALQADLSVIASYQLFRLFFIMLLTPLMFRRWLKQE